MLVGIISRPSSITSQIPPTLLNYGPWIVQNLGFRSLSQRDFIRFLSILVNMLVGIISRPSSTTSQIPLCTPELWPLNCPKLGFTPFRSKSFHPVFIKLGEYVGGHNISTKFYNQPNPPGTPELWPLNCPKNELAVSALQMNILLPKIVSLTLNLPQIRRA